MHDLLRDACVITAGNESFLHVVDLVGSATPQSQPDQTPRRLSIHPGASPAHEVMSKGKFFIRSFLYTSKLPINPAQMDLYFPFLQVLDALVVQLIEFPDVITRLLHLRYLALFCKGSIPRSISKLHNLQTLVYHYQLNPHSRYIVLPDQVIWALPTLRHLYLKPGSNFMYNPPYYRLPQNSSILEHLQTLVGLRNFTWSREITSRIPNLKKLGVLYGVSSFVDWSSYHRECLVHLHQLETLKINVWKDDQITFTSCDNPPELVFPQMLKKITLSGCGIPWASVTTAIGALQNLEELKLRCEACSGPSWTTVEGGFPNLKILLLEKMLLANWETDAEHHFPRLQRLVIRSCGMLQEIPSSIGEIPTLELIELVHCLPSAVASALQIQEEQESNGNEGLKVRIGEQGH